jgi:hypothetical protein
MTTDITDFAGLPPRPSRPQLKLAVVNGHRHRSQPTPVVLPLPHQGYPDVKPLPGRRLDLDLRALERQHHAAHEHHTTRGELRSLDGPARGVVLCFLVYIATGLLGVIGLALYAWLSR